MDDSEKGVHRPNGREQREFFLSRKKNLAVSLLLLCGCYTAVLYPAYFPREAKAWRQDSLAQRREEGLLNRSAGLLSRACRPGWSRERLRAVHPGRLPLAVPVFLRDVGGEQRLSPPLGLRGSEERAAAALGSLPQSGLPPSLAAGGCRRCVVVGSGGILLGSRLGDHIDQHDVIIRMNSAPVSGFERDAGSRTTIRLTYPEGAPHSPREYTNTSLVALAVFKSSDLDWLTGVVAQKPLGWWTRLWFWQEVVDSIPLRPENFRILNPEIIRETREVLLGLSEAPGHQGSHSKMVPTLGASAVVMALQLCDEVSLAGFGYDLQHSDTPLHYYESLHMDAIKVQVVHDVSMEKTFLRELVGATVLNDLTGGLT
uniref:Lactosylceramide alpha-2,3-sialyltransferase n=1 Tax=Lepisosteus oculatus TaxID=7918 RepID=W5MRT9_LEPOC|nr:PREDICTED: lactosylceramide alpha-2,3-sialyltransferase-like [Lepisosteus oculatus]